jgi:hypothetical protein
VRLVRAEVEVSIESILTKVPDAEVRLVGTASSVLRGIELPANDVDILFRDRADVDSWFGALAAHFDADAPPTWIDDSQQYFARLHDGELTVELSTVEFESDGDTTECAGEGPWRHFDLVACGSLTMPAVATELRLITEVIRGRADRSVPILEHLRRVGCDLELIRRGLRDADVTPDVIARLTAELG